MKKGISNELSRCIIRFCLEKRSEFFPSMGSLANAADVKVSFLKKILYGVVCFTEENLDGIRFRLNEELWPAMLPDLATLKADEIVNNSKTDLVKAAVGEAIEVIGKGEDSVVVRISIPLARKICEMLAVENKKK